MTDATGTITLPPISLGIAPVGISGSGSISGTMQVGQTPTVVWPTLTGQTPISTTYSILYTLGGEAVYTYKTGSTPQSFDALVSADVGKRFFLATTAYGYGTLVGEAPAAASVLTDVVSSVVTAPTISGIPDLSTPTGTGVIVNCAGYATGTGLLWSLTGLDWATINPTTGQITGTPPAAGSFVATVTASNGGGSASYSFVATISAAAATAPGQVTGLTATASSGQVALSWTAPGTGGSAITDYLIEVSVGGGAWSTVSDGVSTATSYTHTGLTNGTAYSYRVSAINAIGTGTASATASATPESATTLGIVANRFQVPTTTSSTTAPYTSRRHHYAAGAGDISDIRCVDVGWYLTTAGPVSVADRQIKRYIEYPQDVFHPVLWSGVGTVTITGGTSVKSDVVNSSITGLPLVIPAGAKFWERTVLLTTMANPVINMPTYNSALGTGDGNATSDKGNSGTISVTATTNTFGAAAMVGTIGASNARSCIVHGDSITWGTGDETSLGDKGGSGWFARWMDLATIPYTKIAIPSYQASQAASHTTAVIDLLANIGFVSDVISAFGTNDLRTTRTPAQLSADVTTILGMSAAAGAAPLRTWQTTMMPRTSSTDSWATVANQTPMTDGNWAQMPAFNALVRTGQIGGTTGFIDASDAASTARESGIWAGPFPPTADASHPTSAKAAAIAAAVYFETGWE